LDEKLPGIDAFMAEMAFQREDSEATEEAARAALDRGENSSSANLLLALNAWRTCALRGKSATEAAKEADRLLFQGAQAQPSDESVWYFWAEMMRFVGRGDQAQRRMLGAMHRWQPARRPVRMVWPVRLRVWLGMMPGAIGSRGPPPGRRAGWRPIPPGRPGFRPRRGEPGLCRTGSSSYRPRPLGRQAGRADF
jgi:hypothetical protein